MLTDTPADLNLSSMPIADKVARYDHALFYAAMLDGLQREARRCGSCFAHGAVADPMPSDVEEHLALAVMIARNAHLTPAAPIEERHACAIRSLDDGFAQAMLRDLVQALAALEIHFRIRAEGLDREHMKSTRLLWSTPRRPCDATQQPRPSLSVGASQANVASFVRSFFKELELPRDDEH